MGFDLAALMGLASVVVPVASAIASAVNHVIREKMAAEEEVPAWLLSSAAVLNVLSINLDKAAQLAKIAKK